MMPQHDSRSSSVSTPLRIDVFCRVIDNFGDVGVTWRLARAWLQRGHAVRLWIDDASALTWMASESASERQAIQVVPFDSAGSTDAHGDVGDVVVEAFGCEVPQAFVAWMKAKPCSPVWLNLEYLSAEDHARKNHGLASPQQHGAGAGLVKWFFYPGFVDGTGGLAQIEATLPFEDPDMALPTRLPIAQRAASSRKVLLFTYPQAPLTALFDALNSKPTQMLLAQGPSLDATQRLLGQTPNRWSNLTWRTLPWLDQRRFDGVLRACELNVVRGEDSLVSATRCGKPFIWHAYPQSDLAHHAKVQALLAVLRPPDPIAKAWHRLNGMTDGPMPSLDANVGSETVEPARSLRPPWFSPSPPSLADTLIEFVRSKQFAHP
jgi:uncharacterized repeat protein (TIGR03837 family)